jgi:hypothetical protein
MTLSRKKGAIVPQMWNGRPFRILALDPGGTTGWAYCDFNYPILDYKTLSISLDDFKFTSGHIGPGDHHSELFDFITGLYRRNGPEIPDLELVCESFEFRQHINKDEAKTKVELMSKEYIGIVKLIAEQCEIPLAFQTASAAKHLVPDKGPQANVKLKQLGVYQPVTHWVHAMDAMRHLLFYMVRDKRIREPITDRWLNA